MGPNQNLLRSQPTKAKPQTNLHLTPMITHSYSHTYIISKEFSCLEQVFWSVLLSEDVVRGSVVGIRKSCWHQNPICDFCDFYVEGRKLVW